MSLPRTAVAMLVVCASLLLAPSAAFADDYYSTTDASDVIVAPTGTISGRGGAVGGTVVVVDLTVVCPVAGTIEELDLTFEQHRRGQVTKGYTDYSSAAIPCSPEGTHHLLGLEVFTNVYFGPGRIVVTESRVCGLSSCFSFDVGAVVILHRV